MRVPDAIAPEVGYRTWAVGLGQLWSVQGPGRIRWPRSQPLRANCLKHGPAGLFTSRPPGHPAPDRHCACGIYGVFEYLPARRADPEPLARRGAAKLRRSPDPWNVETRAPRGPWTLVSGRVEGWGRVILGARGFRAELARPVELFAEEWWDERAAHNVGAVAAAYRIPVVVEHFAVAR